MGGPSGPGGCISLLVSLGTVWYPGDCPGGALLERRQDIFAGVDSNDIVPSVGLDCLRQLLVKVSVPTELRPNMLT